MFCEESFEKIRTKDIVVFRNGTVDEFYRLKASITWEQVNISVVEKRKKKTLYEKNFDG